jgi:hypothetical protein
MATKPPGLFARLYRRFGWATPNDVYNIGVQIVAAVQDDTQELSQLNKNLLKIMASIDQLIQDVADESTLEDSLIALVGNLQTQLQDALSGVNVPAPVQAKLDAAFTTLEQNKQKLAAALASNTPAAPSTPGATDSSGNVTPVDNGNQVS